MNDIGIYTDRKVYSIPNGLNELIYDISKEVLRAQPKNIYQFISRYLMTLLKVREAVRVAVPLIEEDFTKVDTEVDFLKRYNLSKEQGNRFALIIQAAFRGYRTRKKLANLADEYKREEARSFVSRIESVNEEDVDYEDPIFKVLKTRGVSKEKSIEAATKIQAYFRGYKVRKLEKAKGMECLVRQVPSHESWRHDWLKEPILSKRATLDDLPWRKSFIDFHKNFVRRHEGDRLQMETIFGGKYDDYNLMCEYSSCQELEVPQVTGIKELLRPGDSASSSSEALSIPVEGEIKEQLIKDGVGELLIFQQDDFEKKSMISATFFLDSPGTHTQETDKVPVEALPIREKSITQLRDSKHIERAPSLTKSEGSKSRGSKGSVTSLSQEVSAPELQVRSLSFTDDEGGGKSKVSVVSEHDDATSIISEISVADEKQMTAKTSGSEGERSRMGSKTSVLTEGGKSIISKTSDVSVDAEKLSTRGSKKSLSDADVVSKKSGDDKSASKKSEVE